MAPAATSPTPATEAGEIARLTQRLSAPAPDDGSASLRNFAPDAATDCLVDFFRSGFEAAKRARLRELCTSGMAATTPNEVRLARKSIFIGPQSHGRKWQVQIQGLNGTRIQIGQFHDEEEAALAYNKAILDRGLQAHGRRINPVDADGRPLPKAPKSSKYYGVYRQHPTQAKWTAKVRTWKKLGHDGKEHHIGLYDSELDAAQAVDAYLLRFSPRMYASRANFPPQDDRLEALRRAVHLDEEPASDVPYAPLSRGPDASGAFYL